MNENEPRRLTKEEVVYPALTFGYKENRLLAYKTRREVLEDDHTTDCIYLFQVRRMHHDKSYFEKRGINPIDWSEKRFVDERENGEFMDNIFIDHETIAIFGSRDEAYYYGENIFKKPYIVWGVPCGSPLVARYLRDEWDDFIKGKEFDPSIVDDGIEVDVLFSHDYWLYCQSIMDAGYEFDGEGNIMKGEESISNECLVKIDLAEKYLDVEGIFISKQNAIYHGKRTSHHYSGHEVGTMPCKGILAEFIKHVRERERIVS